MLRHNSAGRRDASATFGGNYATISPANVALAMYAFVQRELYRNF